MFKTLKNKAYYVGGMVRDEFLHLPSTDIDYVVEATKEEFERVFPEAIHVGNSFPVYILDGHEVALTRKEKCVGDSYQDFECEAGVSIVEDLRRRDFTINAIAKSVDTGIIVDPYGGMIDLISGCIRNVNRDAFCEDPLRILRGARFASRFGFAIEKSTMKLMKENAHKLVHVNKERIELEIRKNYEQSAKPSVFFRVLEECDALKHIFPEFEKARIVPAGKIEHHPEGSVWNHLLISFDTAKANGYNYHIGIAALLHDLSKIATPEIEWPRHIAHETRLEVIKEFFENNRFDSKTMKIATLASFYHMRFHFLDKMGDLKIIRFVRKIKDNLEEMIAVANCDHFLNATKMVILRNAERAIKETKIDLPDTCKRLDQIQQFVENEITKTYKRIKETGNETINI